MRVYLPALGFELKRHLHGAQYLAVARRVKIMRSWACR